MRPHGPWLIRSRREVYSDPWLTVVHDEVIRPDGNPGTFTVSHVRPGVCVLALDDADIVHLTEEFHYGVGRHTLEGVSGGTDDGEDPLKTARRELAEELGITAADWTDLGTVDPFTTPVVSPTRLYLARGLTIGQARPEGTELIRRVEMPFTDAVRAVFDGRITHAPTCVLLLKTQILFGKPLG